MLSQFLPIFNKPFVHPDSLPVIDMCVSSCQQKGYNEGLHTGAAIGQEDGHKLGQQHGAKIGSEVQTNICS